jgi:hypothetical protein
MAWVLLVVIGAAYSSYVPGYNTREECEAAKVVLQPQIQWTHAACIPKYQSLRP